MRRVPCLLFPVLFVLFGVGHSRTRAPTAPPWEDHGVICDLKECNFPCICQKLVWATDFNHPLIGGATDEICAKWKKDKDIPDDKCLWKCIAMAQHIDAAAGADPYVCFKAVEEAKQLDRDDKAMSFKAVSTQLKRRRHSKTLRSDLSHFSQSQTNTVRAWKIDSPRSVPPPRHLIPTNWVAGAKFKERVVDAHGETVDT